MQTSSYGNLSNNNLFCFVLLFFFLPPLHFDVCLEAFQASICIFQKLQKSGPSLLMKMGLQLWNY